MDGGELGNGLDLGGVLRAAFLDPLQGLLPLHVLQPEVGVLVGSEAGGGRQQGEDGEEGSERTHRFILPGVFLGRFTQY